VINRVDTLGRWCHAAADLIFAWRDGTPILDLEDGFDDDLSAADSDFHPSDTDSSDDFSADDSSTDGSQSGASVAGVDDDDNVDDNDNDNDDNNNDDDDDHDDDFQEEDNEHDNEHDFQEEDNEHEAPDEEGPNNNEAPNEDEAQEAANEADANKEAGNIAADDMVEAPAFEAIEAPMISDAEDDTKMNDNPVETPGVSDEMEAMEDPPRKHRSGNKWGPSRKPRSGDTTECGHCL
jgi:hypothetical protein